ncbi:MAG: hypothetical protein AAF570_18115 [Bacteroidota bacterium]
MIAPGKGWFLKFTEAIDMKHCDIFPKGTRVAALEGIGTVDWVDILPQNCHQWLQKAWVSEGHYLEFSLTPDNKHIKIRFVEGIVDVHSQAFDAPTDNIK